MKKLVIFAVFPFLIYSFKLNPIKKEVHIKPGTYTLSVVFNEESTSVKEGIVINENNTFVYFDKVKNKEIKGTWTIEKDVIIFSSEEKLPIKNKWTIDSNESCLKARQGLAFYRICNC